MTSRMVWAASLIHFLALESALIHLAIKNQRIQAEELGLILIPIVFLTLTLPLWWLRIQDEP
jgi:hypothetical protein